MDNQAIAATAGVDTSLNGLLQKIADKGGFEVGAPDKKVFGTDPKIELLAAEKSLAMKAYVKGTEKSLAEVGQLLQNKTLEPWTVGEGDAAWQVLPYFDGSGFTAINTDPATFDKNQIIAVKSDERSFAGRIYEQVTAAGKTVFSSVFDYNKENICTQITISLAAGGDKRLRAVYVRDEIGAYAITESELNVELPNVIDSEGFAKYLSRMLDPVNFGMIYP